MNFLTSFLYKTIFKKFIIETVIKNVDKLLGMLPENEAKTLTGAAISVLGYAIQIIPSACEYACFLLEHLEKLPSQQMLEGGIIFSAVGLFHKLIKMAVDKFSDSPSTGTVKLMAKDITKQIVEDDDDRLIVV